MSTFSPESRFASRVVPSPNHDARTLGAPDILLFHYTGMASTDDALALLCEPAAKVSCHYLVREDGVIVQLVSEARRAWHAGVSFWGGGNDINSRSIGIEIANGGHEYGLPDYPDRQIESLIALSLDVLARHAIRADLVLAHSDVAPTRKRDPGVKFPWARLAHEGVGLWVPPVDIAPGPVLAAGDAGEAVARLQDDLAAYGYVLARTGVFDGDTVAVVTAFQRRFRPARVDGAADRSTLATLAALLEAKAALVA